MEKRIRKIIGINAYHGDSSACLVVDGKLVAAVEEERYTRIKHWAGFPSESVLYCLRESGLSLADIDAIVINSDPRANLFRKFIYVILNRPNSALLFDRIKNIWKRLWVKKESAKVSLIAQFKGKVARIEHHRAHLASAFFLSPFQEAVTVAVDGFGDFTSTSWGVGKKSDIKIALVFSTYFSSCSSYMP